MNMDVNPYEAGLDFFIKLNKVWDNKLCGGELCWDNRFCRGELNNTVRYLHYEEDPKNMVGNLCEREG